MLWYLVTMIASISSERNFKTFSGNVTQTCMDGGSHYALMCGPRGAFGAESLSF